MDALENQCGSEDEREGFRDSGLMAIPANAQLN